jgi:hypothetical protein
MNQKRRGKKVKDKTMGTIFWIAVGLVVVGLGITAVMTIVRDVLDDANDKKPTVPTSSIERNVNDFDGLSTTYQV